MHGEIGQRVGGGGRNGRMEEGMVGRCVRVQVAREMGRLRVQGDGGSVGEVHGTRKANEIPTAGVRTEAAAHGGDPSVPTGQKPQPLSVCPAGAGRTHLSAGRSQDPGAGGLRAP